MLVSIITPCFNPGAELVDTIKSVQRQSYKNYEHIIIDDCSTQPFSDELLQVIEQCPRIKLIQRSWNAGPAVTRNRGISEAKGVFIAFLDADDIWHPDKLALQVAFMVDNDLELSYTAYDVMDGRGRVIGQRTPPESLSYKDLLCSNQIGCLTAMYSTVKLGKVYMPNIKMRQDLGLWLSILRNGIVAKGIVDKSLGRYRMGHTSLSSKKRKVIKYQWSVYRDIERLPLIKSIGYFSYYAYRGISRKV